MEGLLDVFEDFNEHMAARDRIEMKVFDKFKFFRQSTSA